MLEVKPEQELARLCLRHKTQALEDRSAETQNSAFDLKIATLSSKLGSLFEASWRDGSH